MTAAQWPAMRIAHLNTETGWRGGEAQVLHLVRYLRAHDQHTIVITPPRAALARRCASEGIETHEIPMRGSLDVRAIRRLASLLRREQVDVLHMHTGNAVGLGVWAAWLAGTPVRLATRRVDFPIRRNWLARRRYTHGLDRVICISDGVRQVLIDAGLPPRMLAVIYSAVDPTRFADADGARARATLGLDAHTPLIVNVAALTDHKGQRYLLDAMPTVLKQHPDAHLVIAGEGELRQALQAQITQLGLGERVRLLGQRDDVPDLLAAATVFVLPSVLEGLGTSLLDAMCCGTPVVATRTGGIPEGVMDGETGLLVPARDADALARAIVGMLTPSPERERMIEQARVMVEQKFSVEHMGNSYLSWYASLLQEKRAEQ